MTQFDDEKIYFSCPNCPATYNFTDFFELEHMSQADPSEGRDVLGHARCSNCSKDFYYYLSSDMYPILVKNDPSPEVLLHTLEHSDKGEPVQPDPLQSKDIGHGDTGRNEQGKIAQFEEALNDIDSTLPPPELNERISKALDIIIAESPPQIEAGFALLKKKLKLTARTIEAFRKEVNGKRAQIETEKDKNEIDALFSKIAGPPKRLSKEEEKEAIEYLKDPSLFKNISRDIATAGEVVGEETNKMMLYLAATSRKFKKPISLVVFGKSSSGKSYVANAVEKFMPEEDTLVLSSMTAKALEYAGDQLKHKCLLVQEWEGLKEALPTLRVLQSEGKLSRYVTIIDPITKTRKAIAHDLECPCSVIVTTTKEGIHDENSTRIFELYADESLEQTKNVVRQNLMRADMSKCVSEEEKSWTLKLHHNVQRVLETVEVNVPFAGHLTFPAKTTRHRRDSERFINLIKAVAFLRQKQKEVVTKNDVKYIDADTEDYRIAYEIGIDIIRATLNTISDRSKNVLRVCCELNDKYLAEKKDPLFSVTEIQETAERLGLDFRNRTDLYKQLDTLEEYEYLERQQAKKNSTKYYKLCFAYERDDAGNIINIDTPDIKEILTPERLRDNPREPQEPPHYEPEIPRKMRRV